MKEKTKDIIVMAIAAVLILGLFIVVGTMLK